MYGFQPIISTSLARTRGQRLPCSGQNHRPDLRKLHNLIFAEISAFGALWRIKSTRDSDPASWPRGHSLAAPCAPGRHSGECVESAQIERCAEDSAAQKKSMGRTLPSVPVESLTQAGERSGGPHQRQRHRALPRCSRLATLVTFGGWRRNAATACLFTPGGPFQPGHGAGDAFFPQQQKK
jgi:hypothetical protein